LFTKYSVNLQKKNNMRKNYILLFIFCCFLQQGFAQISLLGSSEHGRIFDLTYDSTTPNKVYALSLTNHILVSNDNGVTWVVFYSHPNKGSIHQLELTDNGKALSFYDDDREVCLVDIATGLLIKSYIMPAQDTNYGLAGYAIYKNNTNIILGIEGIEGSSIGSIVKYKVYLTTDGGENWNQVYYSDDNQTISVNKVAISPDDPQKLYITLGNGTTTVDGGLWVSTDGGTTWADKIPGIVLDPIMIDPTNPDVIWAGTGVSFGGNPENLYKSTDGGQTWSTMPIEWNNYLMDNIVSIRVNPKNADNVLVLEEDQVLITNDRGQNWTNHSYSNAADNLNGYYYGLNASYNPHSTHEILISGNYYPLRSTDDGNTMQRIKIPYSQTGRFISITTVNTDKYLSYGIQNGYIVNNKTTGVDTEYNLMPLNYSTINDYGYVADKNIPGRIYLLGSGFMGSTISVSNDFGKTTTLLYSTFSNSIESVVTYPGNNNKILLSLSSFGSPEIVKIDFSDPNNVITENVTVQNALLPVELCFDNVSGTIYAASGNLLMKSNDDCVTWTTISNGLSDLGTNDIIYKIVQNALNLNELTLATSAGIFLSSDKGNSWTRVSENPVRNIAFSTINDKTIIGVQYSSLNATFQIVVSNNHGVTWNVVANDKLMGVYSSGVDFDFTDADNIDIYASTNDIGVLKYAMNTITLGISQPQSVDNSIDVYPNPASNFINVKTNKAIKLIKLMTLDGHKVAESTLNTMNISSLPKGIYIVSVTTQSGQQTFNKLVKE